MKINIKGKEYSFKFYHNNPPISKYSGGKVNKKVRVPLDRGTVCIIFNEQGDEVAEGIATLHPHDNFCKEKGRRVSLARAMKFWSKENRTLVWEEYKTWGNKNRW